MSRLLFALLVFLAAEAVSEDFDPTQSHLLYAVKGQRSDVVPWRKLDRSDFQGEAPPPNLVDHAGLIGAVSCVGISLPPDAGAAISLERLATGQRRYGARLYQPRFTAVFDKLCSWWNPNSDDPRYLLEHEQLHFDLTEVAARRLSQELIAGTKSIATRAATQEAAIAKLDARIGILTKTALKALRERHSRLDQETSVERSPERQADWVRRVAAELALTPRELTHPTARVPPPGQ